MKVEVDSIVERHLISRMRESIAAIQTLVNEWLAIGTVPENDWSRMRALDFQEILRSRDILIESSRNRSCEVCGDFERHVSPILFSRVAITQLMPQTVFHCSWRASSQSEHSKSKISHLGPKFGAHSRL